jgi:hypothetical protein
VAKNIGEIDPDTKDMTDLFLVFRTRTFQGMANPSNCKEAHAGSIVIQKI